MLFMVVERFRHGPDPIGARFRERGRMIPAGVEYVASWIDLDGSRCFQVMEAPTRASLDPWIESWSDLVAFEVTPVLASGDFWAQPPRA